MIIRPFEHKDEADFMLVESAAEKECGFSFRSMMDIFDDPNSDSVYGWGIWTDDNKIVGYCSAGEADELDDNDDILSDENIHFGTDDIVISDVYILPECRGKSYGSQLVKHIVDTYPDRNKFVDILYDELNAFYEPLGFRRVKNNASLLVSLAFESPVASVTGGSTK